MKVILLQELKGKGIEGDVVEVANGFANNYLLPKKLAIVATKGNLKQLDQRRHNIAKRESDRIGSAEQMKAKLEGVIVQIDARVGEEGQLFGSVTTQMISDALREQHGIEVDKKLIDLKVAVKTVGKHEATVALHRDIKSTIQLVVGDAAAFAAAQEEPEAEAAVEEVEKAVEASEPAAE
jgi:large subunit ribosomal protein L9